MSLLLDALRRAEEAKRAKAPAEGAATSPASKLEPPAHNPPAPDLQLDDRGAIAPPANAQDAALPPAVVRPARPLDLSLEDVERSAPAAPNNVVSSAGAPNPAATGSIQPSNSPGTDLSLEPVGAVRSPLSPPQLPINEAAQREQIKSAFAAKVGTSKKSSGTRQWLAPTVAVVLVALGGGGWYVWNEINKIGKPRMATNARPTVPPAPAANASAMTSPSQVDERRAASALPVPSAATGQLAGEAAKPGDSAASVSIPQIPPLLPPALVAPPPKDVSVASTRTLTDPERLAKAIKDAAPKSATALSLKPSSSTATTTNPDVAEGYSALQSGDLRRALSAYDRALQADAYNLDAQLGLAATAARSGNPALAARHFRLALEIDPRNGYAQAGLVSLAAERHGDLLEADLRAHLSQNPDAAALHFALGNLFATQKRWNDAQQAYFDAWRIEPERADYAFNLAVSLDQLRQPALARDYYQKALALVGQGGAQFDSAVANRRLSELAQLVPK
jgi:tetratricopeptide (TPR) repeat protein